MTEEITGRVIETMDNGKGFWSYTKMGVFCGETQIGEYTRNYPSHGEETFAYFEQGEYKYALYSPHYTTTQVMSLPGCNNIGGEEPQSFGFCPVEIYVPWRENGGMFGFVSGCVWGDDSGGWKLEHVDLSDVRTGNIKRTGKFGYLMIPGSSSLAEYVEDNWDTLSKEEPTEEEIASLPQFIWDFDDEDEEAG